MASRSRAYGCSSKHAVDNSDDAPCKILVLGDYATGKTSIIKRYVDGSFTKNYKVTVGVDFMLKRVNWSNDRKLNLQFWDVAGNERNCGFLTRVYYRYAAAAIIVCDISRPCTFESAKLWVADLNDKLEEGIPKVLFINKCDLTEFQVESRKIDKFCEELKIAGWYTVSAKTAKNIDESLNFLITQIMKRRSSKKLSTSSLVKKNVLCKKNYDPKKMAKMAFLTQIDSYMADNPNEVIRLDESMFDYDDGEAKCC